LRRLWWWLRRRRKEDELREELQFHLEEEADQLHADGVSEEQARWAARRDLGNVTLLQEQTRTLWTSTLIEQLGHDVRYALRTMASNKTFTATVVFTLAIGIGANTAVFSAIDAVLLRPLAFPDPDRLVRLTHVTDRFGETDTAAVRLDEWARLSSTFVAITHYTDEDVSDTTGDTPQPVRRSTVGPRFLDVVGIPPLLGRGFTDAEHRLGGPDVALISERYWRNRFGGDSQVLGRAIRMAKRRYTIVGVLPREFAFPADVDWWVPQYIDAPWTQARQLAYAGVGRLKPGVSLDQARADLENAQARLAQQFPKTDRDLRPRVTPLKETYVGDVRASLWLLFGSVSVLLLIACTNIAALLLTRGAQRQQEIAIRQALGGSRRAVAMQLLTESTVLTVMGAAVGLVLAMAMTAGLRELAPTFPRLDTVTLSGPVLIYLVAITTAVAVLCGLVPAFRATTLHTVRIGTHAQVVPRQPLHWWLVGVQVALAVTLLAGAGLLVRSLDLLSRVDAGFDPARVLTFRVTGAFGEERYSDTVQRIDRTLDALASVPGVDAAATALMLPGLPGPNQIAFTVVEAPTTDGSTTMATFRFVSPRYFQAMAISVLEGELCRDAIVLPEVTRPLEVMVNQAFAARYLTDRSIGAGHLSFAANRDSPLRIAGVVANVREVGLDAEPVPIAYPCFSAATPMPWFLVRSAARQAVAIEDIRRALRNVDPLRSVYDVVPLDARIDGVYAPTRVRTILLTLFAIAALLLACLGVYGALSYLVGLRRREAALRVALGASRLGIIAQFCGHALRVIGAACVSGLLISAVSTRALSGMLYRVSPLDPLTLSGVVALVLTVGSIAALLPSVRAALAEPAQVLRGE
jgi:predicted permease